LRDKGIHTPSEYREMVRVALGRLGTHRLSSAPRKWATPAPPTKPSAQFARCLTGRSAHFAEITTPSNMSG